MELKILLPQIEALKKEIKELSSLTQEQQTQIMQKFQLDWNYNSNHLEGNSLTFKEVQLFLIYGLTAKSKPLKDHLDLKGHNEALSLLPNFIKEGKPITEDFIKHIHKTIFQENHQVKVQLTNGQVVLRDITVGQYKTQPNNVKTQSGKIHYFASPEETPVKMQEVLKWYEQTSQNKNIHPLFLAAIFHHNFLRICPFDSGNGQVARILMNLTLMRTGYLPVIIKATEKEDYYKALGQADAGNQEEFVKYIGRQLLESTSFYLRSAKGQNLEEVMDIDKEIDSFKASLSEIEDSLWLSVEIAQTAFENVIAPLTQLIFSKLSKFDELFVKHEISYVLSYNRTSTAFKDHIDDHRTTFPSVIDLLVALQKEFTKIKLRQEMPIKRYINYKLMDLKKSKKRRNSSGGLGFRFNDADFLSIYSDTVPLLGYN